MVLWRLRAPGGERDFLEKVLMRFPRTLPFRGGTFLMMKASVEYSFDRARRH